GRPGFKSLLLRLAEIYRGKRADLEESAGRLTAAFSDLNRPVPGRDILTQSLISQAAAELSARFDDVRGGFGGAPK
ncbi:MAG: thioredoxin domain-containing protein, partial [Nitrospinota bacterium]|nr:thioredoxin domain-containing protein [Nitrospinota bacterium]